jgi:hypothetical protein
VDMTCYGTRTATVADVTHFWDFGVLHYRVTFDDGMVGKIKAGVYRTGRWETEDLVSSNGDSRFYSMPVSWHPEVGQSVRFEKYRYGSKGFLEA